MEGKITIPISEYNKLLEDKRELVDLRQRYSNLEKMHDELFDKEIKLLENIAKAKRNFIVRLLLRNKL